MARNEPMQIWQRLPVNWPQSTHGGSSAAPPTPLMALEPSECFGEIGVPCEHLHDDGHDGDDDDDDEDDEDDDDEDDDADDADDDNVFLVFWALCLADVWPRAPHRVDGHRARGSDVSSGL